MSSGRERFFSGSYAEREKIVQRFESAWSRGEDPEIDAFLAKASPQDHDEDSRRYRELVLDLIRADMEARIKAGRPARVETYADRYPLVAEDSRELVDLVEFEFELRRRRDPTLSLTEYLERFPEFESVILERAQVEAKEGFALSQVGPYRLLAKIGQGGMGVVYRARHSKIDKLVALKILPESRSRDKRAAARFLREAIAAGSSAHANVIATHDAGEDHGVPFLVMDLLTGPDVAELAQSSKRLTMANACEVARQAALGLEHIHGLGFVHRDIKPSNLMLHQVSGQPAMVKILDLGLARLGESTAEESLLTATGQLMGTPYFMSPEQAQDSRSATLASDIYSLGATLFYLLTGKTPFSREDHPTPGDFLHALAVQAAPSIRLVRDDLPHDLVAVVDRMLFQQPAARFVTARAVAEALEPFCAAHRLEECISGEKTLTSSLPDHRPVSTVGVRNHPESTSELERSSPNAEKRRGHRTGRVLAGIFVLAISAGIVWYLARDDRGSANRMDPVGSPPTIIEPSSLRKGLVGYWPFDGKGAEESSVAKKTTLYGNPNYSDGVVRRSICFEPSKKQHVSQDRSGSSVLGTSPSFTIQVWARFHELGSSQRLFEQFTHREGFTIAISRNNTLHDFIELVSFDSKKQVVIEKSVPLRENTWHHFVGRVDNGVMSLFFDGKRVDEQRFSGEYLHATTPVLIGAGVQPDLKTIRDHVSACLDEVAVWSRALNDDEIAALHRRGLEGQAILDD